MLSRYEMAKITGKLVRYEGPDKVKTIERSFSPTSAINTPLIVILFIGIGLGVLAGGASIFLSFLCDSSIQDIDSIEKTTGLKVISVMPIIEGNSILEPNQVSIESNSLN
jgi:capsular polysaccharide biosynthesis protein